MLGDQIVEERGKVIGYRVLEAGAGGSRVEVTFRAPGKILGIDHVDLGTYFGVTEAGGFLFGEGQGVITTKDGDMATWVGHGFGRPQPGGGVSWRGCVYYRTGSQRLSRLNGAVGVFEYETDANDNTVGKVWEWK
jgi:hypothetical protein